MDAHLSLRRSTAYRPDEVMFDVDPNEAHKWGCLNPGRKFIRWILFINRIFILFYTISSIWLFIESVWWHGVLHLVLAYSYFHSSIRVAKRWDEFDVVYNRWSVANSLLVILITQLIVCIIIETFRALNYCKYDGMNRHVKATFANVDFNKVNQGIKDLAKQ